jgi:hypothetical protein
MVCGGGGGSSNSSSSKGGRIGMISLHAIKKFNIIDAQYA